MKWLLLILLGACILVPVQVQAQSCPPDKTCVTNVFAEFGISNPQQLIEKATKGFAAIFGTIAIAFTVFSGFKLMIATNEEAIKSAKQSITWSVGGFALSVLAFTIISGTANLLGFEQPSSVSDTLYSCGFIYAGACDVSRDFTGVLIFVMHNILALIGVVAVVMIVYYGYRYAAAAGNEEGIAAAKNGLKWAISGLIVVMLAFALIAGTQRLLFGVL